jgi:hypothetical protein
MLDFCSEAYMMYEYPSIRECSQTHCMHMYLYSLGECLYVFVRICICIVFKEEKYQ